MLSSIIQIQRSFLQILMPKMYNLIIFHQTLKPLSHWDAASTRWVCESIRQTVANCRETFAWYHKVFPCIANSSRTVRQSFKHVILFCATKIIANLSPSHRICREPVANPSPTLRRCSQIHHKEVSAICTMQQICDINKTISRPTTFYFSILNVLCNLL